MTRKMASRRDAEYYALSIEQEGCIEDELGIGVSGEEFYIGIR